jgi:bifunctional enzyme CysN/CysC
MVVGQKVKIPPLQKSLKIKEIITYDGNLQSAQKGDAVTIRLNENVDVTRGRVIVDEKDEVKIADQFQANVIWMDEKPGFVGRGYFLKIGTTLVNAIITKIKHKINIDNLNSSPANELIFNNIYEVSIKLNKEILCDKFSDYPGTGSFILIDKESLNTVGGGMINFVLHRSHNLFKQKFKITTKDRFLLNGHKAKVIWFTGLSGSGKSTIANELEKKLYSMGIRTFILDGDNVRQGLNSDIGFKDADRIENIRRVSEVAKLMFDAGLVVIVSFISPFRSERDMARKLFKKNQFFEVFVNTPLNIAEKRDPKGLYKKARKGLLPNFTGIDSPYQKPIKPEITLDTTTKKTKNCSELIVKKIFKNPIQIEN